MCSYTVVINVFLVGLLAGCLSLFALYLYAFSCPLFCVLLLILFRFCFCQGHLDISSQANWGHPWGLPQNISLKKKVFIR